MGGEGLQSPCVEHGSGFVEGQIGEGGELLFGHGGGNVCDIMTESTWNENARQESRMYFRKCEEAYESIAKCPSPTYLFGGNVSEQDFRSSGGLREYAFSHQS